MSTQTIRNGASIVINLQPGETLKVVAVSGTYTLTGRAGSVAGTIIATAATGGTYGPYAEAVTLQLTSSALSEIDFDSGTAPVIDSDTPAMVINNPLTGGNAGLIGPDGVLNESILGAGGIRAIIIGDSRTQQNVDQSTTAITNRARWFTTLNALLGQKFELVNNAGVNGDTAAGVLARVKNAVYGAGFGSIGDNATAVTTNPGAGIPAEEVFLNIGTNDIFGAGTAAATVWASTKQIADIIRGSGKTLVLCTVMAPNSALSGYTTAKVGQLMVYNDLIRDYCRTNRGVYLYDHFAAAISPTAAAVETAAADLRDGTNHENNRGGYRIAKAGVSLFSGLPARQGLLPSSNAATSALDASIKHLRVNPLLTGTVAITATGYSGNAATGLGNGNFVRGGSATAVLSKVTRADGYGDNLKFACTFTANNETIEMRDNSYHAQAVAGGRYMAVAEVSYTGPSGANLALADNLKNVQLFIQYTDGSGNLFVYDLGVQSTDGALFNSETMVLKTPILQLPATLNTPTVLRAVVTITGAGAGSPEVSIGRLDLIAL